MTKVNLNFKSIQNAAQEAFLESCEELGQTFTEVITDSSAFSEYPGRDLVDTGALRDSQSFTVLGDNRVEFAWDVEYAILQHEGYTLRNGEEWIGRPWTAVGLKRYNFSDSYARNLRRKLNG